MLRGETGFMSFQGRSLGKDRLAFYCQLHHSKAVAGLYHTCDSSPVVLMIPPVHRFEQDKFARTVPVPGRLAQDGIHLLTFA